MRRGFLITGIVVGVVLISYMHNMHAYMDKPGGLDLGETLLALGYATGLFLCVIVVLMTAGSKIKEMRRTIGGTLLFVAGLFFGNNYGFIDFDRLRLAPGALSIDEIYTTVGFLVGLIALIFILFAFVWRKKA